MRMSFEKTLAFQGRKIFYRVIGDGPTVMLLHGLPFDGNLWQRQWQALPGFKFIIPDLPGSGASEIIEDTSMEGMSEAIKVIVDAETSSQPLSSGAGWGKLILIGHSMGGYIALAFAEKYPGYLKGLGLFHSTAYADSEERKQTRRNGIDTIRKNGAHEFLKTLVPNLFSPDSRANIPDSIDKLNAKTTNFSAPALVSYYEAMMRRPDRTAVLNELKIPMLFIAGKHDTAAPLNDLLKLCHLPEISYFHILAQSGHMGMIEEQEKSNKILNEYLINLS